jgi:hypothetical protein
MLLQVFDRLSLYLCMPPQQGTKLGPAPVGGGESAVTLDLTPAGGNAVTIEPWPFCTESVTLGVLTRKVPHRAYGSDDDFRQELAAADAVTLTYVLRAP